MMNARRTVDAMASRLVVGGMALFAAIVVLPVFVPQGLAVGSCLSPATPAPVAGTILGTLPSAGSDTWSYDFGSEGVVVNAISLGGRIMFTFEGGCAPDSPRCIHHEPTLTPVGGGTYALPPTYPNCHVGKGSLTVTQDPPTAGDTQYLLRICPKSTALAGFCPAT